MKSKFKPLLICALIVTMSLSLIGCSGSDDEYVPIYSYRSMEDIINDDDLTKEEDIRIAIDTYLEHMISSEEDPTIDAVREFLTCLSDDDGLSGSEDYDPELQKQGIIKRQTILECLKERDCGPYNVVLSEIAYRYDQCIGIFKDVNSGSEIVDTFQYTICEFNGGLSDATLIGRFEDSVLGEKALCLTEYEPFEFCTMDFDWHCVIYVPKGTQLKSGEIYDFDNLYNLDSLYQEKWEDQGGLSILIEPREDDKKAFNLLFEKRDEIPWDDLKPISELASDAVSEY